MSVERPPIVQPNFLWRCVLSDCVPLFKPWHIWSKVQRVMTAIDLKVAANGRMVLPKSVREAMGLSGDTKVTAIVEAGGVRLVPIGHRVMRARELYLQAVKSPRTTEDFLRDRREEAGHDEASISDPAPRARWCWMHRPCWRFCVTSRGRTSLPATCPEADQPQTTRCRHSAASLLAGKLSGLAVSY